MKEKTNLELFYNEIEYTIKHSDKTAYYALYRTLFDIYYRETGEEKTSSMIDMLKWYADVPRETFEVTAEMYAFLKAYASSEFVNDEAPLDSSVSSSILIDIGIIPKKYSKMPLKEFIKIIRLKKESNKWKSIFSD